MLKLIVVIAAYIATIFAANWAIATFGVVPVWPVPLIMAPAGVAFVGLAFPLRDFIQRQKGRKVSIAAMLIASALSYLVSPHFAIASGLTFLISETADLLVYTGLQKRFKLAVSTSSVVALVVDSVVFLMLAFGSLAFLLGQVVGKAESVVVVLCVIVVYQAARAAYWRRSIPGLTGGDLNLSNAALGEIAADLRVDRESA